jgi:hypothetical protein
MLRLRLLLLGLLVLALSVKVQPIQKQTKADNPQQGQAASQQQPAPSPPPIAPLSDEQKSADNGSKTQEKAWNWPDSIAPPTWSNWALVLVGLGATIAALLTLKGINHQTVAVRRQEIAMRRQTRVAIDTARRQLRAYVSVSVALLKPYGPNQFEAQITVKNCGQTPAYKVDHRINTWIGPVNTPYASLPQPGSLSVREGDAVLGPDQTLILTRQRETFGGLPEGPLGGPGKLVYAYGSVWYEDAFGRGQRTRFCVCWNGRMTTLRDGQQMGVFNTTNEGNDAT